MLTTKQMYEKHLEQPPTFSNLTESKMRQIAESPNAYCDDQGFEGCFVIDGDKVVFHRWIEDEYDPEIEALKEKIKSMDDIQLENAWQGYCSTIQGLLMTYFSSKDENLRTRAERTRVFQGIIQDEIARRSK